MTHKELVERVAKSICDGKWDAKNFNETPNGDTPDEFRAGWRDIATAAIATILEVLENMTPEMLEAAVHADYGSNLGARAMNCYLAGLRASPLVGDKP